VIVTDSSGAPVAKFPVQFTVTSGGGVIGVASTVTSAAGVATAGSWTLGPVGGTQVVTATAPGFAPVAFPANGKIPDHLVFASPPGGTIATKVRNASGQAVVLELRDASNALVLTPAVVTAAIASGSGTVTATTTATTVNGVATFDNLKISGSDVFTLAFTAPSVTGVTSAPFSGNRSPVAVALTRQPIASYSGRQLSVYPLAILVDASGYKVLEASATISVAVASGNFVLSGPTTALLAPGPNGAGFPGLGGTGSGTFTLVLSAPGMASATSAPTTVVPGVITVDVGASATAAVAVGSNLGSTITLDMANAGGRNIGSITFTLGWDPTKWTFVSASVNAGAALSLSANTANAASGSVVVAGFAGAGVTTSQTLMTLVLKAKAAGTTGVNAVVTAAGDELAARIAVGVRNLSVTISP
jgi:hypothetical protein